MGPFTNEIWYHSQHFEDNQFVVKKIIMKMLNVWLWNEDWDIEDLQKLPFDMSRKHKSA